MTFELCGSFPLSYTVYIPAIGDHHLEYGFPSTHSTNSVSIALHFFSAAYKLYTTPVASTSLLSSTLNTTLADASSDVVLPEMMLSHTGFMVASGILGFYVFSIVFGRLYTGMHSFTDCVFGILLGSSIWGCHYMLGGYIDYWIAHSGWIGKSSIFITTVTDS